MFKALVLTLALSLCGFAENQQTQQQSETKTAVSAARESDLAKSIEKQELRHFELHRFFIPVTQGNLQWLTTHVGAKPDEALVVWKLMREYDAARAARLLQKDLDSGRNPS